MAAIVRRDNTVSDSPPALTVHVGTDTLEERLQKMSESRTVATSLGPPSGVGDRDEPSEKALGRLSEEGFEQDSFMTVPKPAIQVFYYTDASEVEELLDGSGVSGSLLRGVSYTFISIPSSSQEDEVGDGEETHSDTDQAADQPEPSGTTSAPPRQLSNSRRAALRKILTKNCPIKIPLGHTVIALREGQMHTAYHC